MNTSWFVRKSAFGWMVCQHLPGDAAPTFRGEWPTKRQALADMRFKRALAAGKFDHVGPPRDRDAVRGEA